MTAGLAAYTSLKAVQGMVLGTGRIARETAQTGRQAMAAGATNNVRGFSAYALAASETVGADPAQVQQDIADLQQNIITFRERGREGWTGRLENLAKAGVAISPEERDLTFDKLMDRIADRLATLRDPATRLNWAQAQGFGPGTANFLALERSQQRRALQEATPRATTGRQIEELTKLDNTITKVINEYSSLWRELVTRFSEQGLEPALKGFAGLLRSLQESEEGMKAAQVAVGITFAGGVGVAVIAVGKLAEAIFGLTKNPGVALLRTLARTFGPWAALSAYFNLGKGGDIPADESKLPGADPQVSPYFRQNARPGADAPRTLRDDRTLWERKMPRWLGGKDAPAATAPIIGGGKVGSGSGFNYGMLKQLALDSGFAGEDAAIMAAISMGESSGNPYARNITDRERSFGLTQINAMAHVGGEQAYGDPTYAMNKAYQLYQNRKARGQRGFEDWTVFTKGAYMQHIDAARAAQPQPYPRGDQVASDQAAASAHNRSVYASLNSTGPTTGMTQKQQHELNLSAGGRGIFPPDTKFNSRGEAYADTPKGDLAAVAASMRAIQTTRWADRPVNQSTSNVSNASNVGQVVVQTQATDADGIAKSIAGAINRNMQTTDFNTGID